MKKPSNSWPTVTSLVNVHIAMQKELMVTNAKSVAHPSLQLI